VIVVLRKSEQYFNYIMARTNNISMRWWWWWCPLCTGRKQNLILVYLVRYNANFDAYKKSLKIPKG